jgi:hypothetical protein
MRKRKNRTFLKHNLLKSAPKSSILNKIARNYKQCCFEFVHMQHIFIKSFGHFKASVYLFHINIEVSKFINSHPITENNNFVCQYNISQSKLLLSGDIEINPGPPPNTNSLTRLPSHLVLEQRLRRYQLRPFDVGGDGDCFFRAVSHQMNGDPEHLEVRAAGIAYMRNNPERFIESNTQNSWLEYLNNMSMQGTWGNATIIQAVADQLKLKITIAETHGGLPEYSIVQPVSSIQQLTDVYLGHIDEYHYMYQHCHVL